MGIGGFIAIIAIGAILTFATDWHMNGVNLDLAGIIGMASIMSIARRRRAVTEETVVEREHHHGPLI
jgi:uncharacterized membrane protein